MNCQIGNDKYRPLQIYQTHLRMKHIITFQCHPSCRRQRSIQPGVQYRSTIDFHIQLRVSFSHEFRMLFYPQPRKICMSCCDPESFCLHLVSNCKCNNSRTILLHIIFSACFQLPWAVHDQWFKSCHLQFLHDRRCHMKR